MHLIEPNQSQKLALEYEKRFGETPPMEAYFMPEEEMHKKIAEALERGEPVPEWVGKPFGSRQGPKPMRIHEDIENVSDQTR